MSVFLSPVGGAGAQFFDNNGVPLTGGKLHTYSAGTTTPLATYTTSSGGTAHANPIVLNSAGRVADSGEVWLTNAVVYKFVLKTADDVLIATWDNVSGIGQDVTASDVSFTGFKSQTGNVQNLADSDGSDWIGFQANGVAATPRSAQDKMRDFINATDFGVLGDGTTDDWDAFYSACVAAVAADKALNIDGLKIYLGTQDASISSENLYLVGNGIPSPAVNWDYMTGLNNQFNTVRASVLSQDGSIIISRFNGAIFTGKTFSGENFAVMGDPSQSSSSCFDTGVPSSYPGWSQPLKNLHKFAGYYFGSDGFKLQGGLEIVALYDVSMNYCNGYCLNIYQTSGVDSPIEYIDWNDSYMTNGLLGNVFLNGARKHVKFDNVCLNNPGQLARRAASGFVVTIETDIVYGVTIYKDSTIIALQDVTVIDCYAEESQGIAVIGGLVNSVNIQRNYLLAYNNSWPYYHAKFDAQSFNIRTSENTSPSGVRFYFTPGVHSDSEGIYLGEKWDSSSGFVQGGAGLSGSQLRPGLMTTISEPAGDGTAATFTVNIASLLAWGAIANSESSRFSAFLVSSNWQASNADTVGAYLVYVTRMASGNYVAIVQSTGTVTGFSSAPTMSTAGVLRIPLSESYRARVTRLDLSNLYT
jgi:hypothetical protein